MAALSYIGLYGMILVEIVTGLVMYQRLLHNAILLALVGWIPRLVSVQNLRLIHFFLMYVFFAFAVFHVHLCMLVSRAEKRGLMDSIFIGYKVIPVDEIEREEKKEAVHQ
jgi:Ni/Fe-hydrogenase 1 B-type cytochrome subunit